MTEETWPSGTPAELIARRDALRMAASAPGSDPDTLLEAALADLDAALDFLADASDTAQDAGGPAAPDGSVAERRLLRAAFQQAPVALFLLERDGTVRRANATAGELVGIPTGYATGKPLTAFVDLPSRAALSSLLAAAARTGEPQRITCRLVGANGPVETTLRVRVISLPGDPRLLVVSAEAAQPPAPGEPPRPQRDTGAGTVQRMTRRMDMIIAVTRLLLDNSTFSEAVTLQRCARLLAEQLAGWVIVDVERAGTLQRQVAIGPQDEAADQLAKAVRTTEPEPGTLIGQVHATGKPMLVAHADDPGILGTAPDGTPLLMLLGCTSLICVPFWDGESSYGTLTLARSAGEGRFEVADLALAGELGEDVAMALRVDRLFRRRSEVAQALQASLLPSRLPEIPGLELAASYMAATKWQEISGDFYDVFRVQDSPSWGIMIGDVCGKGEEAAAMTAAARHATRAVGHRNADPVAVLKTVNDVLYAGDYEDRFVTAQLAFVSETDGGWNVRLSGAGHPGPALLRADGRVEIMECNGLPLGLFPDLPGRLTELTLYPGDLLLFFTDGVTEAGSAGTGYFEDRLADELAGVAGRSAAEAVRTIQEMVADFCGGVLRDDMTMAAARVTRPHSSS